MPRAMWSGSISFALVNIPVKMFSAISQKDVHFHQLHDADGVRIQQKRICPLDGKEVPYEHIVKGYEIEPNKYVIIKPEELAALDPKAQRTIEIERFVEAGQIDPLFIEYSYYLVPDKGAVKPYALLMQAMKDTKRVAIARTVIRTKQYVTALRPSGNALSMSTLYFADEVVEQSVLEGLPDKTVKLGDKELNMARQLVESLTDKFEPEIYVPRTGAGADRQESARRSGCGSAAQAGRREGHQSYGRAGSQPGERPERFQSQGHRGGREGWRKEA